MYLKDTRTPAVVRDGKMYMFAELKSIFNLDELLDSNWDEFEVDCGYLVRLRFKKPITITVKVRKGNKSKLSKQVKRCLEIEDGSDGFILVNMELNMSYKISESSNELNLPASNVGTLFMVSEEHHVDVTEIKSNLSIGNLYSNLEEAVRNATIHHNIYALDLSLGNRLRSAS